MKKAKKISTKKTTKSTQKPGAYDFRALESKWQDVWEKADFSRATDLDKERDKLYYLVEFPYPSGAGLHVGHAYSYTPMDTRARMMRMRGYNVLFPIGWDAFGLPTENYAIKMKRQPAEVTAENVAIFKNQMSRLALSFDYEREVNTTDPSYYKWTQWIFLQFFNHYYDRVEGKPKPIEDLPIPDDVKANGDKAVSEYKNQHRMAYKKEIPVNWCPSCKIVLANEEVIGDGECERCHYRPVERRNQAQWMMRITEYADRLITDLDQVDYEHKIATQQINWIGRSEGARIKFRVDWTDDEFWVFTTRPDTIYGVTFMVLAPEHPLVPAITTVEQKKEVEKYVERSMHKSELARQEDTNEKTGVFTGAYAINPVDGTKIPIWIADYVLADYGEGAIMGVPAHDERDFEFAKKFGFEVINVIKDELGETKEGEYYKGKGPLMNSDKYDGMDSAGAIEKITQDLAKTDQGEIAVDYNLRDWVFSRQHYWGEPIPVVDCERCGHVAIPEEELPLELPEVESYEPTDTGESPLAAITEWVEIGCPKCGGPARRETDTMPNWAGSSWYFLRYIDPHNDKAFADSEKLKYWMQVDHYDGGMEHTTLHVLYSRFWHKYLHDLGFVERAEPYAKRTAHGIVLGPDGRKMSKTFGNVIDPMDVIENVGSDATRMYVMFMGPYGQDNAWSDEAVQGVRRFLDKVYTMAIDRVDGESHKMSDEVEAEINKLIQDITKKLEGMRFNTCVSDFMKFVKALDDIEGKIDAALWGKFVRLFAVFAPHIGEEMWQMLGQKESVFVSEWPEADESKIVSGKVGVGVQINGKIRSSVEISPDAAEKEVREMVLADETVQKYLDGKKPKKFVYVPGRIVSVVV